eukprot:1926099-Rhodomonas_salina.2
MSGRTLRDVSTDMSGRNICYISTAHGVWRYAMPILKGPVGPYATSGPGIAEPIQYYETVA